MNIHDIYCPVAAHVDESCGVKGQTFLRVLNPAFAVAVTVSCPFMIPAKNDAIALSPWIWI